MRHFCFNNLLLAALLSAVVVVVVTVGESVAAAATTSPSSTTPKWPSPVWDEIDSIIYQDSGFMATGFTDLFTPCSRTNAVALRIGFHDLAGRNESAGIGGIDASLRFELMFAENVPTFNEIYFYLTDYSNSRASLADLSAAALVAAVARCQGPNIPLRVGRVDATEAIPDTAFRPSHTEDSISELMGNFTLMGFNNTELISLIACAHTLGGVEHDEHPTIVNEVKVMFDSTNLVYDNKVVTEYLDNQSQNPLVVGPSKSDADFRIFSSDGNVTINTMREPSVYASTCQRMLAKLIDRVPSTVSLSQPIVPYEVKPVAVNYDFDDTGALVLSGYIRVRSTVATPTSVTVTAKDNSTSITVVPVNNGTSSGGFPEESFQFFSFSKTIEKTSISAYTVDVTYDNGQTTKFDNNGTSFPIEPRVFFARNSSCVSPQDVMNWTATIVVAVSKDLASHPVQLIYTQGVRNADRFAAAYDFIQQTINMTQMTDQPSAANATHVLFSAQITTNAWTRNQATFDVTVNNVTSQFNKLTDIVGQTCASQVVALDWTLGYVDYTNNDTQTTRKMIGVNGAWPIHTVYANAGDTLQINLKNSLDVPTSLHFHGIQHRGQPQYDGAPFVTQCPIPAGSSFTYTMTLDQPGTFWIEGDYMGQSVDGLRTALIVRSTSDVKVNNDYVVQFAEWYEQDYPTILNVFKSVNNPLGTLPTPSSLLIREDSDASIDFNTGETYMLRLISMMGQMSLILSMDAHNMTIVEVDGVSIEPYEVTTLTIAPAQRFGVLVTGVQDTNSTNVNYQMHVTQQIPGADADGTESGGAKDALSSFMVLSYSDTNPIVNTTDADASEAGASFILYNDTVLPSLTLSTPTPLLKPTQQIVLDTKLQMMSDGSNRGTFNGIAYTTPLVPSLMTALSVKPELQANTVVYGSDTNPYILKSGVTELVIMNGNSKHYSFHLHGHSFQLIAIQTMPYDAGKVTEPTTGPPSRDTVHIPSNYFAVLRFTNDNPGVWLFSSSSAFLRDAGWAATLIETPNSINATSISPAFAEICQAGGYKSRGNAAGNNGTDMSGYITSARPAITGTTPQFWGTVFGCGISVIILVASVHFFELNDELFVKGLDRNKEDTN